MRTQNRNLPRPLMRIAGVMLTVACAVSIAVSLVWVPTSIGRPAPILAPSEIPSGLAQHRGARTALPGIHASKVRCTNCGVIGPTRGVGNPGEAGGNNQYADSGSSPAVATGSNQSGGNGDLAIFLDWHMNVRSASGSIRHEFGCALSCRDSASRF